MEDRDLDMILREIACERIAPTEGLVRRTKARLRGRRLLQVMAVCSLSTQLMAMGVVLWLLTSPEVEPAAKIFGTVGLFAYLGCIVVAAVAARDRVIWLFRRLESLTL